jgi:hypothetical protein
LKAALFGAVILVLVITVLRGGGLQPVLAQPEPSDDDQAIQLVRRFEPVPGNPETIDARILRVIDNSRRAGMSEEVVGWTTQPLGDRRYYVHFALRENGVWIGAEWFVNMQNGWVNPTNQYASWLMFDRNW